MMIAVRRAELSDIPWMAEQVMAFADASGYKNIADPAYMPELGRTIVSKHYATIAYDQETGERVGLLCAFLMPHTYNPSITVLSELCWWVAPQYRVSTAGLALLTTYINWGKRNADMVTLSLLENSGINHASLTKRGFKKQETAFVWEKD